MLIQYIGAIIVGGTFSFLVPIYDGNYHISGMIVNILSVVVWNVIYFAWIKEAYERFRKKKTIIKSDKAEVTIE